LWLHRLVLGLIITLGITALWLDLKVMVGW
jgi:hypothetical protein